MGEEAAKPFWLKCVLCAHVWIGAYVPMEVSKFARIVGRAHCPKCAAPAKDIVPAKQDDGVLKEAT